MCDCELITLISAISCAIIKCSTEDELTILSAALTQLGDTLATYLAQKTVIEKRAEEKEEKKKEEKRNCEAGKEKDVEE